MEIGKYTDEEKDYLRSFVGGDANALIAAMEEVELDEIPRAHLILMHLQNKWCRNGPLGDINEYIAEVALFDESVVVNRDLMAPLFYQNVDNLVRIRCLHGHYASPEELDADLDLLAEARIMKGSVRDRFKVQLGYFQFRSLWLRPQGDPFGEFDTLIAELKVLRDDPKNLRSLINDMAVHILMERVLEGMFDLPELLHVELDALVHGGYLPEDRAKRIMDSQFGVAFFLSEVSRGVQEAVDPAYRNELIIAVDIPWGDEA